MRWMRLHSNIKSFLYINLCVDGFHKCTKHMINMYNRIASEISRIRGLNPIDVYLVKPQVEIENTLFSRRQNENIFIHIVLREIIISMEHNNLQFFHSSQKFTADISIFLKLYASIGNAQYVIQFFFLEHFHSRVGTFLFLAINAFY